MEIRWRRDTGPTIGWSLRTACARLAKAMRRCSRLSRGVRHHMRRSAVSFAVILVFTSLLSGCVVLPGEHAELVGPLSAYGGEYRIRLQQVEGSVKYNGHGAFGRTVVITDIRLPQAPEGLRSYSATDIKLESDDDPSRAAPAVSGTVEFNRADRTVVVALQTPGGPSLLNGTYRLLRELQ